MPSAPVSTVVDERHLGRSPFWVSRPSLLVASPGQFAKAGEPEDTATDVTVGALMFGVGMTYYFMPINLYVTGAIGPARVILEAISRVCEAGETPNRANVQAEVRATDQADTILGSPISFTADGDLVEGQFFIFEIQDDGSKILVS